ncbi:hypothetical protein BGX29_010060 [Mortierella sp. GBA35]|nr:hypothetical protein BGX29_010060 [Mortierella sp. GBA35]
MAFPLAPMPPMGRLTSLEVNFPECLNDYAFLDFYPICRSRRPSLLQAFWIFQISSYLTVLKKFDVEQAVADVDELYPDEGDEEQDHDQAKENSRVLDAATRARLLSHVPRYAMTHLVMTFGPGYLRTTSTDIKYVLKRCPNIQDLTFRDLGSFIDENELGNVVTTCCPRLGRLCFDAKDIEACTNLRHLDLVVDEVPLPELLSYLRLPVQEPGNLGSDLMPPPETAQIDFAWQDRLNRQIGTLTALKHLMMHSYF